MSYFQRVFLDKNQSVTIFLIYSELHLVNDSQSSAFDRETSHRSQCFMVVHNQKSSESKRESRDSKVHSSTDRKRLSPHIVLQALLVRSGRFHFAAPKSEGTAASI